MSATLGGSEDSFYGMMVLHYIILNEPVDDYGKMANDLGITIEEAERGLAWATQHDFLTHYGGLGDQPAD